MADLYDKDGNLVEGAMNPEEVNVKLDEIKEEAKKENEGVVEGLKTDVQTKETDLKKATEDLEAEKLKDKNLAGQRKIIEEKEEAIKTIQKDLDDLKEEVPKKIKELDQKAKDKSIGDMMAELAGSDDKLREKIKFYYDTFKPIDETDKKPEDIEKEIRERVKNAYVLARGGKATNPL